MSNEGKKQHRTTAKKSPLSESVSTIAADAVREQIARRTHQDAVEVLPKRAQASAAIDRLKEIESELLEDAAGIVKNAMLFHTINRDAEAPPQEWIDMLGPEEAMSKFRQIKAGWERSGDAPIGVKVATNIASSILKKTRDEDRSPILNAKVVEINFSPQMYPKLKVDT